LPREDDFISTINIAADELKEKDPVAVGRLSQTGYDPEKREFTLDFIGRPHTVQWPEGKVQAMDTDLEVPLQEQGLILHYLNKADGSDVTGELITYREVPSGEFYYPAFVKRAEAPLITVFGRDVSRLIEAGKMIGGEASSDMGDVALRVQAFPSVALTLVIWEGDDEFEPTGKILFDKNIQHYLSTEDVAVLSGMAVYRLMRFASQV
jgi:hypothetical protein